MTGEMSHFSASQINLFLAEPALWVLRRYYGVKPEVGAGAWRGNALEAAMDHYLYRPDSDDEALQQAALNRFEADAVGELDEGEIDKARAEIPQYLANLLPWLRARDWSAPVGRQLRIDLPIDGASTPVTGYVDYMWDDELWDLKTTGRMPSADKETGKLKDKGDHLRQVAVYWAARGVQPALLYVTPGKSKEPFLYYPSEDELREALSEVRAAVRAMDRLNRNSADMVAPLYPPRDPHGCRWDASTRAYAAKVWDLEVAG